MYPRDFQYHRRRFLRNGESQPPLEEWLEDQERIRLLNGSWSSIFSDLFLTYILETSFLRLLAIPQDQMFYEERNIYHSIDVTESFWNKDAPTFLNIPRNRRQR